MTVDYNAFFLVALVDQQLVVLYRGVGGYSICADNWTADYSNASCRHLGYTCVINSFFQFSGETHERRFFLTAQVWLVDIRSL